MLFFSAFWGNGLNGIEKCKFENRHHHSPDQLFDYRYFIETDNEKLFRPPAST